MVDRPTQTWADWGQHEWNEALVEAVFDMRPGAPPVITRIDATSKFLSNVARASSRDSERVRKKFSECFRGSAWTVRRLFNYELQTVSWRPEHANLPFFAQLYFTLLVASADEETHSIGNFRERLVALLDLPSSSSFSLYGLSDLWRAAELWTRKTTRKSVRRLQLPPLGSETIIGYAKRLAFPGFVDQVLLAKVLTENALDAESTVIKVVDAVSRKRSKFSPRFNEEFQSFTRTFDAGDREGALSSPFWGAVQDISWEHTQRHTRKQHGFLLELDVVDPYAPFLMLYSNGDLSERHAPWQSVVRQHLIGEFKYEVQLDGHVSGSSIEVLRSKLARGLLGHSALWREISNGCVVFGKDDFGRWIAVSKLSEGEQCWLLLSSDKWDRVRQVLRVRNQLPAFNLRFAGSTNWGLLGQFTLTDELRGSLRKALPELDAFDIRLIPERIRLHESLWLPEGLLLVERALPRASMRGSTRMQWTATFGSETKAVTGWLSVDSSADEPLFQFVRAEARAISEPATIAITAIDDADVILDRKEFATVPACRSWEIKQPGDMRRWLEAGDNGQLVSADETILHDSRAGAAHSSADIYPVHLGGESGINPIRVAPDDVSDLWRDAMEVLSATFAGSAAVSSSEFYELVRRLWEPSERSTWSCIQDLVENGLVRQLMSRRWHGSSFIARPPSIYASPTNGGWLVRLVGLAPRVLRRELTFVAKKHGGQPHILSSPDGSMFGALEIEVQTRESIVDIASELSLPVRVTSRLDQMRLSRWRDIFSSVPESPKGEMTVWSSSYRTFVRDEDSQAAIPRLEMWRAEGSQQLFVLRAESRTWTTRSRIWALLAHKVESHTPLGSTASDGSVRLDSPHLMMPPALSLAVMRFGGGLCLRDSQGRRIYSAGPCWAPQSLLGLWIAPQKPTRPMYGWARARLEPALATQVGGVAARALGRYWSAARRR